MMLFFYEFFNDEPIGHTHLPIFFHKFSPFLRILFYDEAHLKR